MSHVSCGDDDVVAVCGGGGDHHYHHTHPFHDDNNEASKKISMIIYSTPWCVLVKSWSNLPSSPPGVEVGSSPSGGGVVTSSSCADLRGWDKPTVARKAAVKTKRLHESIHDFTGLFTSVFCVVTTCSANLRDRKSVV